LPTVAPVIEKTRVQLCGTLSVEIDGVQIVGALRGRQVRLLLTYLILNRGRSVGREELSDAIWPFSAPQSQDGALRTLLSRLRSAVGPAVLAGREQLALVLPEPVWVDLEAARAQIVRALAALSDGDARGAWALAQVPLNIASRGLLPGTDAVWLEAPRRELEEIRLQALEVIGRAGLVLGGSQLASAERAARALIASEPYRESAYTLLMEALAAQGNVAEGVRAFEQLRSLLRQELGTLPSPDALAVHEQLLNPPARPVSSPVVLPSLGEELIPLPAELRTSAQASLVGRAHELSELEQLWQLARLGTGGHAPAGGPASPRAVVLGGDPGVGKTRLASELARRVHDEGAVVLAGRAPEESLVPYQPFLEALRHYVAWAPIEDLRATAREYGAEVARLVPELRRRVPELAPGEPAEPDTERYRLFEAVVGLLGAIARRAPVLLVLDDLHWADRPTLLLLRHLARAAEPRRLLILLAYRAIEVLPAGFAAMLADLHRERLLAELSIGGLSESETAELVLLRTGEAPAAAFVHALHGETEGNPLFVEEIIRHLAEAGVRPAEAQPGDLQRFGLPEGVKQVIARRLARFDASATEWLRTAAVIGRDFDSRLLERVLGIDEDAFLDALEQALESGLVRESSARPGSYSFSHALIREVLYESMSAPRRSRIHRRVGEALEADGRESELGALAHHFAHAATEEEATKALGYAQAAGDRAGGLAAHEEAVEHYGRALEVLERFAPDDQRRRCELLLLQGEAQARSADPALAWEALSTAAAIAEQLGDGAAVTRAAIAASRRYLQQPGVVDEPLIELLERALAMTAGERTAARVLLLARLCGALYFSPGRGRMRALSQEAAQIAAELGDPEAEIYACAAARRALWDPGHLEERVRASTRMLMLARETGQLEQQLQAHAWLVVDLLEQGDRDAVVAQIEAFSAGAARLRQPLFAWHASVWRAMQALIGGALERAEALAGAALAVGATAELRAAAQYYGIQLLAIRREQERMAELEQAAEAFVADNPGRPAWQAALADLYLHTGQGDRAAEALGRLLADDLEAIPRDGDWLPAMALLTDVISGLRDRPAAARLYELMAPYRNQNIVIGLGTVCLGATSRSLGRLAAVAGERATAVGHLEHALEANERLGAVLELAHTRVDLAEVLGPGIRARRLAGDAAQTAAELELPLVAARAAPLLARRR
jgi:DNA-binding SARP family transcriptional activator/tetratricopeptide (TPR) repeat protein